MRFARAPNVVVAVGIVPGTPAFNKPFMLVRAVVDNQVDDQAHVTPFDAREHGVEVGHSAELGHDLAIVADVVAVVGVGRIEVRTEPDHGDAQSLQEVELAGDARQVPDAVAVRVLERARIDLIDHSLFPPHASITVDWVRFRRVRCILRRSARREGKNDKYETVDCPMHALLLNPAENWSESQSYYSGTQREP